MGHGGYDVTRRSLKATTKGYHTKTKEEIFSSNLDSEMSPHGVTIRESRDSQEHPNSIPIVLALDLTGSMGHIPHHMIKNGLPHIMGTIIQRGTPDPQLLFLGIGDHQTDDAPLQVGQFESSDELLDKWLEKIWLESGGGANAGESYLLAWFFAARYTSTDHNEKRGKKGYLFTVGDEPTLKTVPGDVLKSLMGSQHEESISVEGILSEVREKYEVFHLHISETRTGSSSSVQQGWKDLLGQNCVIVDNHEDVSKIIADIVLAGEGSSPTQEQYTESQESGEETEPEDSKTKTEKPKITL